MSSLDEPLQAALARVHERISAAARAAGREPSEIALLAVSKAFPAEAVIAAARAGQRRFGENYVQEAVEKIAQVRDMAPDLALEWHFIGPIQSNKTRAIAERFDWVHSVDRLKIAQRLSQQRPPDRPPLAVLIQVNVSGEASKSGIAPAEASTLAHAVARLPRLRLRGLMAIPAPEQDAARQRMPFARLRELLEGLQREGLAVDTLSMGMSADLEAAIAEGATIVRVGTAIFGERT
ncbi:YggS family pyridoxal phosphate-dependent enzyme [Betaproteobacteria bacterium PRO7]|jgi:pyridoxal phosphate enzyme (YggS family)|nr:YggS family pyridoxal phosphate-dependent enzyme [Betaproteobacteria bacterium PRO7]